MKVLSVTLIIDEKLGPKYPVEDYSNIISNAIVDELEVDIIDGNVNMFELGMEMLK